MAIYKLEDLIVAAIKENGKTIYAFNVGQKVRIKSTLTYDITDVEDMLGQIGVVKSRRCAIFVSEKWYNIRVGNRIEPFKEYELDYRYRKG